MLDHVLVPLDGSPLAEVALDYAMRLVAPKGRITLLTTVRALEFPTFGFYPPKVASEKMEQFHHVIHAMLTQAESYLEQVAARLESAGVQVEIKVEFGDPADLIIAQARKLNVDAIVMSTHGRSGLTRWLFGSVTGKVLTVAVCPVFVVPNVEEEQPAAAVSD